MYIFQYLPICTASFVLVKNKTLHCLAMFIASLAIPTHYFRLQIFFVKISMSIEPFCNCIIIINVILLCGYNLCVGLHLELRCYV